MMSSTQTSLATTDLSAIILIPPFNFSAVDYGIYRSGLPKPANFPFLKTLGLRSIVYLCPEPYPAENMQFANANGIRVLQIGLQGSREAFARTPHDVILGALRLISDERNRPLLIHCKQGKHRTGCIVGCLRKSQNWSLPPILDEYCRFAADKARATDQKFIQLFEVSGIKQLESSSP